MQIISYTQFVNTSSLYYIRKKKQLKSILIVAVILLSFQTSYAQVTIGSGESPNKDAILDLKQDLETKKGLLLPRVLLESTTSFNPMSAHTEGMVVYNTATAGDVTPGHYYNNGTKWMKLFSAEDSFFYMPSTVLPIDENDPAFEVDKFKINLHNIYAKQFDLEAASSKIVASDPSASLPFYKSDKLYYFITYYDDEVFENVGISTTGELTYTLKANFIYSEKTFMNIVFKVK